MSQVNATSLKFSKKRDIISELTLSELQSARMGHTEEDLPKTIRW
ncbi:hypothetical protein ACFWMS_03430 [Peribacillus butanolivorans]